MKETTARIAKFLGLRSDTQPERMTLGDLSEALNVRLDESGRISRRAGRTRVLTGAVHSLWADGELMFGVASNTLCRIAADYSTTALLTGMGAAPVRYARVGERVYWSNGLACGCIEGGVNRPWGLPVPATIAAVAIAGSLPAGRYQYSLTHMRSDGQESGAARANVIDLPEGSGIRIVAAAALGATHAVLYLSKAGGETMYRALEIATGLTGDYVSNGADLVSPLQTQFMGPPLPCEALAWFGGRLWLGLGDSLLPSAPFSPELFDYRADLPLQGGVTMLAPLHNQAGMFVGTATHTLFLTGPDPDNMSLLVKQAEGVIAGALTQVPGKLFGEGTLDQDIPVWAGARGLFAGMPDGTVSSLTQGRHPLALSGRGAAYFDTDLKHVVMSAI